MHNLCMLYNLCPWYRECASHGNEFETSGIIKKDNVVTLFWMYVTTLNVGMMCIEHNLGN